MHFGAGAWSRRFAFSIPKSTDPVEKPRFFWGSIDWGEGIRQPTRRIARCLWSIIPFVTKLFLEFKGSGCVPFAPVMRTPSCPIWQDANCPNCRLRLLVKCSTKPGEAWCVLASSLICDTVIPSGSSMLGDVPLLALDVPIAAACKYSGEVNNDDGNILFQINSKNYFKMLLLFISAACALLLFFSHYWL